MLRVKSFDIRDDKAINELLSKYRLASGAHILVSDGSVCIPYEDGEPDNTAQRIVAIGEEKNTIIRERDIIEHSNRVLDFLMADAQGRVNVAQVNFDTAKSDGKYRKSAELKELEEKLNNAKSAYEQLASTHRQNAHEVVRLSVNIEKYDEAIEKLNGKN